MDHRVLSGAANGFGRVSYDRECNGSRQSGFFLGFCVSALAVCADFCFISGRIFICKTLYPISESEIDRERVLKTDILFDACLAVNMKYRDLRIFNRVMFPEMNLDEISINI